MRGYENLEGLHYVLNQRVILSVFCTDYGRVVLKWILWKTGSAGEGSIHLAKHKDKWWTRVNSDVKFGCYRCGEFLYYMTNDYVPSKDCFVDLLSYSDTIQHTTDIPTKGNPISMSFLVTVQTTHYYGK
jgi:hypothetical protein